MTELPKDVFTASDLHYRLEGAGYVLYSVGCNGKDDNARGSDERDEANRLCDDLVLRMPGPATETKRK